MRNIRRRRISAIWGRGDPRNSLDDTGWIQPHDRSHRLWPGAAWVDGERLFMFVGDYFLDDTGPAGWNFHFVEEHLATIAVDDIGVRTPTILPDATWLRTSEPAIELGLDAIVSGDSVLITGRGSTPETSSQRYLMSLDASDPTGQDRSLSQDGQDP